MRIIATAVIKGGTGKTSTALALAQAGAAENKKVLVIDLDPQANITLSVGAGQNQAGCYEFITGTAPADAVIQHTEQGIDCIAGSPDLATLKTAPASAMRLAEALAPIKRKYGLIVIDTPPTMGECLYNALQCATDLVIPLQPDTFSTQGLWQICDLARQFQQSNTDLKRIYTVLVKYDKRKKIHRFFADAITENGKELKAPCIGTVRESIAIQEAQAFGVSLFDYAKRSTTAEDYMAIYKTMMRR